MGKTGSKGKAHDDVVEAVVCQFSDLKENEMREVDVGGEGKCLLVKQGDKLRAIGPKCTHYGAPLVKGALGENRVRCPWHGACFNLDTGDIEDFPGLDSLPCHKVSVNKEGGVVITTSKKSLSEAKRRKTLSKCNENEKQQFVILGAGPAGSVCAETLRQEGFNGSIVLVSAEPYPLYDRIKISKQPDASIDKLQLRDFHFYKDADIKVLCSTKGDKIDSEKKLVKLSNGEELNFDKLLIATGSSPFQLKFPGAELKGIFYLRSLDDGHKIASQVGQDKNVVVLGSSFIGMEIAAYCKGKVGSVTVVGRDTAPFKKILGQEIGDRVAQLFREQGVILEMGVSVESLVSSETDASSVGGVKLKDGRTLPADFVLVGYGSYPNTTNGLVEKESLINPNNFGYLPVDEFLATGNKDIFAAGDVALAPVLGGKYTAAIGHWGLAHYHGRMAALNMLGQEKAMNAVPFFWTMLFGKSIRYAGYCPEFESIVWEGSLENLAFCAYFVEKDGRVAAVATVGMDPVGAQFAELLASGKDLLAKNLTPDPTAWRNS